jgi:hypothetical protein
LWEVAWDKVNVLSLKSLPSKWTWKPFWKKNWKSKFKSSIYSFAYFRIFPTKLWHFLHVKIFKKIIKWNFFLSWTHTMLGVSIVECVLEVWNISR